MRFIDVTIPKFGDDFPDAEQAVVRPPGPVATPSRHFSRGGGFLQRPNIEEYNLEENESVVDDPGITTEAEEGNDEFFEAPEITSDVSRVFSLPSRSSN
jgi:hypothetical protein